MSVALAAFIAPAQAQSDLPESSAGIDINAEINRLLGQLSQFPQIPNLPNPSKPLTRDSVDVAGQGNRQYLIETPSNMDPNRTYPVVFGFSGWQHSANMYRDYADLDVAAGQEAILVYPEGNAQAWEGPKYAPSGTGQDVAFVKTILDKVKTQYKVDASRVFATGLSNGGGMALALACQAPETFAAVASVSGAYYNSASLNNCQTGKVDTLVMHGTADDHMLYNGGANDHGGSYYSAPQITQKVAQRNGCTGNALSGPAVSGNVELFTAAGCPVGGDTTHYKVNGGGHSWYAANPVAAQVVWNYFKPH